jgi:hypothetical protein
MPQRFPAGAASKAGEAWQLDSEGRLEGEIEAYNFAGELRLSATEGFAITPEAARVSVKPLGRAAPRSSAAVARVAAER